MSVPDAVACGCFAGLGGIAFVRLGWTRARWIAIAGWAMLATGIGIAARGDGAWGIAVVATVAMAAALAALAQAGLVSRRVTTRPPRDPASITLPRLRELAILRRIATFLLVVPLGFAAAEMLAFGAQASARRAGWDEANVLALAFFTQPAAWAVLATVQMTRARWTRMIAPAAVCAGTGGLLWWQA